MNDLEFMKDRLQYFCNTNEQILSDTPRGIVLEFPGLGGSSCLGGNIEIRPYGASGYAKELADAGLLLAYTFPGPWSWMNSGAVRYCELVADALIEKYGLSPDTPIAVSGGSMGGLGALIFTAESKHRVTACAAACPCYDALSSCLDAVSPNFPRSFISAAASENMPLEEGLKKISPLYRIKDMPHIPYFICADGADHAFPIDGMDRYVEALRAHTDNVTYRKMPGLDHGGFTDEVRAELTRFLIDNCK